VIANYAVRFVSKDSIVLTHPLTSWTLRGFRSIRDRTTLELGGLTILVGANSAGKSSVLHSLLMCAQTLGNPLADRPLVLNGPLVRLGLAEDTVHEASEHSIELGFGLVPVEDLRGPGLWRGGFDQLDVRAILEVTPDGLAGAQSYVRGRGWWWRLGLRASAGRFLTR
jgi:hypothetical protein